MSNSGTVQAGAFSKRRLRECRCGWEITQAYAYRQLTAPPVARELREFLRARAWTRPERAVQLFDQAVAWLWAERMLLPGVSVLARLVAEARGKAARRLHATLRDAVDEQLHNRLTGLLDVPEGSRWFELDRLRRAPTRASGPAMVQALNRAAKLSGLGGTASYGDAVFGVFRLLGYQFSPRLGGRTGPTSGCGA